MIQYEQTHTEVNPTNDKSRAPLTYIATVKSTSARTDTKEVILDDVVEQIRNPGSYTPHLKSVRDMQANEDACEDKEQWKKIHQEKQKYKADNLPALIFSGFWPNATAQSKEPATHSGLICVDVDGLDDVEGVKQKLKSDQHLVLGFISPSGNGLKLVYAHSRGDVGNAYEAHKAAAGDVKAHLESIYPGIGEYTDTAPETVKAACYISHDTAPVYCPSASLLPQCQCQNQSKKTGSKKGTGKNKKSGNGKLDISTWLDTTRGVEDIEGLLERHGWTRDSDSKWIRPGKDQGVSATLGEVTTEINGIEVPLLHVFSSSASIPPGSYTYSSAVAQLEHGGSKESLIWAHMQEEDDSLATRIYYDGNSYYAPLSDRPGYVRMGISQIRKYLSYYYCKYYSEDDSKRIAEATIRIAETEQVPDYVGGLAGSKVGFQQAPNGDQYLITNQSREPVYGQGVEPEGGTLDDYFESLLGAEQKSIMYMWLKQSIENLQAVREEKGTYEPAPAVALIGPKQTGKTMAIKIIEEIMGSRVGATHKYLSGRTDFNSHLVDKELLVSDDEGAPSRYSVRSEVASNLRSMLFDSHVDISTKKERSSTMRPWWRLIMACNDTQRDLEALPELGDNMTDKILLLSTKKSQIPYHDVRSYQKRMQLVRPELPAFVAHVRNEAVLRYDVNDRTGIPSYWSPEILQLLNQTDPKQYIESLLIDEEITDLPCYSIYLRYPEFEKIATVQKLGQILTDLTKEGKIKSRLKDGKKLYTSVSDGRTEKNGKAIHIMDRVPAKD